MSTKVLANYFNKCVDKSELDILLSGLLTENESQEIAKRIQILSKLSTGQTQRAVAQELNVGVATVTRGAKALQSREFKEIMERLLEDV